MHRSVPNNLTRRARAGFTLTELLVAIGAVAILTVGVGRIFASINGLVSTGIAVAEVDQVARTIEQRMREDFDSLSAMNIDETFLVIRMREIGHPNRPIYLSAEDREFDIRAGVSPYDEGSRAVYRRLDEIAFLAGDGSPGQFTSAQADGFFTGGQVQAGAARIYWGHGLKPKLDPDYPDADPANRYPQNDSALRTRPRLFEPDGYFGDAPGAQDNPLSNSGVAIIGRNQFASEWTLTRQPLLLAGPAVSGDVSDLSRPTPAMAGYTASLGSTGARREYAPYIRDIETFNRIWPDLGLSNDFSLPGNTEDYPDPRLIRHGRVDISAMTRAGVQRFLEGEPANADGGAANGQAALAGNPFRGIGEGGGRIGRRATDAAPSNASEVFNIDVVQAPLWRWPERHAGNSTTATLAYRETLRNMRSAIAGVLARPLVEIEPPELDHVFDVTAFDAETAENALMDSHAVIAPRCSSFEVAWSDGSRAKREIDLNNDGLPEFFTGDLVWFDISRLDPTDENAWDGNSIQRFTLEQIQARSGGQPRISSIEWPFGMWTSNPAPIALAIDGRPTGPELNWDRVRSVATMNYVTGPNSGAPGEVVYNPDMTGGAPSWINTPDTFEHLVIFPFRDSVRDASIRGGVGFVDGLSEPWAKPRFIRVRLTLHDSQNRIDGGKQYEFIFPINLD